MPVGFAVVGLVLAHDAACRKAGELAWPSRGSSSGCAATLFGRWVHAAFRIGSTWRCHRRAVVHHRDDLRLPHPLRRGCGGHARAARAETQDRQAVAARRWRSIAAARDRRRLLTCGDRSLCPRRVSTFTSAANAASGSWSPLVMLATYLFARSEAMVAAPRLQASAGDSVRPQPRRRRRRRRTALPDRHNPVGVGREGSRRAEAAGVRRRLRPRQRSPQRRRQQERRRHPGMAVRLLVRLRRQCRPRLDADRRLRGRARASQPARRDIARSHGHLRRCRLPRHRCGQARRMERSRRATNARLGVWLPNPRYVGQLRDETFAAPTWVRLRRFTYLLKDIFGAYSPDDRFVYVTDGGQFDNLGGVRVAQQAMRRDLLRRCFRRQRAGQASSTPTRSTTCASSPGKRLGVLFSLPGQAPDGDTPRRGRRRRRQGDQGPA